MASGKRDEQGDRTPGKDASSYYRLKKQAVEDLVTADESNSPKVSEEELRKYRGRRKFRLADPVKVILIKFWFSAAVCYFFFWGLANYIGALLDQLFVIAVGFGMITDLLTNNAIRYFATTEGSNDKWMMFPKKGLASFFGNILYAFAIIFLVYSIYSMINLAAMRVTGNQETLLLGVEPILFGVFAMGADLLLVGCKGLFLRILQDAKRNAQMAR